MINIKNITKTFFSAILFSTISLNAFAEEGLIPLEHFACKSNFNEFKLSPDGKTLMIINTNKDNVCDIEPDKSLRVEESMRFSGMMLVNLETNETRRVSNGNAEDAVWGAGWLNNDRIWYQPRVKKGSKIDAYVKFAVNTDGSRRRIIEPGSRSYEAVYNIALDDPKHIYVFNNSRRDQIFDYYKVNVYSGKRNLIARGPDIGDMKGKAILGQIADPDGYPRGILIDEGIDRTLYEYDRDNKEWKVHFTFRCQEPGFVPVGTYEGKLLVAGSKFNSNGQLVEENDTNALYLYDTKTREFSEKLYQDPDYDVAGLTGSCRESSGSASSGITSEVESISYWSLQKETIFLNKEAEQTYLAVKSLFPEDIVSIISSSSDRKVLIANVSGTNNPGDIYLVDFNKGAVKLLFQKSPWLDRSELVRAKQVVYTARDGLEIPSLLTLTKQKTDKNYFVVMPHGGPNTQQYIGYDAWAQFMVNRGINVMQPNFRGSTGLGTAHYKAGNMEWGKKMQDDITDAVEWAIENGYADRDRICIAGASYGGYSTMAGLVFTPEVYRCGINAIGVTDQQQLLDNFARKASKFQSWDEEPLLEWGDLSTPEGREYAKEISPLLYVQNIQAPVLVLQGSNDRTVEPFHAEDLITQLEKYNKTYESMFQAYAGHCVTGCGELAALEYLEIQESFLNKYLMN